MRPDRGEAGGDVVDPEVLDAGDPAVRAEEIEPDMGVEHLRSPDQVDPGAGLGADHRGDPHDGAVGSERNLGSRAVEPGDAAAVPPAGPGRDPRRQRRAAQVPQPRRDLHEGPRRHRGLAHVAQPLHRLDLAQLQAGPEVGIAAGKAHVLRHVVGRSLGGPVGLRPQAEPFLEGRGGQIDVGGRIVHGRGPSWRRGVGLSGDRSGLADAPRRNVSGLARRSDRTVTILNQMVNGSLTITFRIGVLLRFAQAPASPGLRTQTPLICQSPPMVTIS